jgi:hypothetical protein
LLSVALLLVLFTCVLWVGAVHAQPVDAGEEPAGGPIVYNPIPTEDAIVAQEELARAGATLERVMNLGKSRIEMRISRSAWFPRAPCFLHS